MAIHDIEHCECHEIHKELIEKVNNHMPDVDELYDLETDPGEIENLIAKEEHKERITCMRHLLIQRLKEIDDPYMRNELIVKQLFDEKKHLR